MCLHTHVCISDSDLSVVRPINNLYRWYCTERLQYLLNNQISCFPPSNGTRLNQLFARFSTIWGKFHRSRMDPIGRY